MINFKQYLAEARMAPLYHGTSLKYFEQMMDNGIQARTYHFDHAVGKKPHKLENGKLMVKEPVTGGIASVPRTYGISTTRRYKFAVSWNRRNHDGEPGVIIEFDQQKLTHRYKLVPVNFYGWGTQVARAKNDSHATNEFEEFIIMPKNSVLPWNTVSKIHVPLDPGGHLAEWANKKGIKVIIDPQLPTY